MALIIGDYCPSFTQGTIHKQERHQFQHSHIDPASVYPSDTVLVRHMEGPLHHKDAVVTPFFWVSKSNISLRTLQPSPHYHTSRHIAVRTLISMALSTLLCTFPHNHP